MIAGPVVSEPRRQPVSGGPCAACPRRRESPAERAPRAVTVTLTQRCSQQCGMCGYPSTTGARDMPMDMFRALLADLRPSVPDRLVLSGGEPTLHRRFQEVVAETEDWPGEIVLVTNGQAVPQGVAESYFKGVGGRRVIVSVHGNPEVHDAITAVRGSFARARDGFRRWRTAWEAAGGRHAPLAINTTLTTENADSVPELLRTAADWGAGTVRLDPVYLPGRPDGGWTRAQCVGLLMRNQEWQAHARELGVRLINLTALMLMRPGACSLSEWGVYVGADGSVHPCIPSKGGFLDSRDGALGSLAESRLSEIWSSGRFREFRSTAQVRGFPFCGACPVQHLAAMFQHGPCAGCEHLMDATGSAPGGSHD